MNVNLFAARLSVRLSVKLSVKLFQFTFKIEISTQGTKSMPFLVFRRDHLRSTSGIVVIGSLVVRDHFRSGDHLR